MVAFPDKPIVPTEDEDEREVEMRYEDVSQDGRLKTGALPHAIGVVTWRTLLARQRSYAAMRAQGVVPILSRIMIEGYGGPIYVRHPLLVRGSFELAHTKGKDGAVDRLMLNLYGEARGVVGSVHGPKPDGAGERILGGRTYAEHVFTKLFAPRDQRKVLELDIEGVPKIPEREHTWVTGDEIVAAPDGATSIDDAMEPDEAAIAFGVTHTDANQHVNSLEYPRLFEDAVLRRLARRGRSTRLLARAVDIRYRKPCFAGDTMRFLVRTFEAGPNIVATGVLVSDAAQDGPPFCYVRMRFEP